MRIIELPERVPLLRAELDVHMRAIIDEMLFTTEQVYNPQNNKVCAGSCEDQSSRQDKP